MKVDKFCAAQDEEVLEAQGINALLGRAPTPGDPAWEKAVAALDLT